MSVITIFSGSYCHGDEIADKVAHELGYKRIDKTLLNWASEKYGVPYEKLDRVMRGSTSLIDKFIHERERHVAYIKAAIAEQVINDKVVYQGLAGHLLPRNITHILKICLVANRDYRSELAIKSKGLSKRSAYRAIKKDNEELKSWTQYLFDLSPWDKNLYDIKIPIHSMSVEDAVKLICDNAKKKPLEVTQSSAKEINDFAFAARVNIAFVEEGHFVEVSSNDGDVTVLINDYVLRVEHLKNELKRIADSVPGVKSTEVRLGPRFKRPTVFEFEMPSKVLLVDDETEFVQTLSERLQMRDLSTAVVYDGEEALSYLKEEEPEVMILDLRMPGIDGVEVLRRVKRNHPNIEVIILTGHGTEKDEALTKDLGAFAYLEKPVEIDTLAKTVKEAYEKIRREQTRKNSGNE